MVFQWFYSDALVCFGFVFLLGFPFNPIVARMCTPKLKAFMRECIVFFFSPLWFCEMHLSHNHIGLSHLPAQVGEVPGLVSQHLAFLLALTRRQRSCRMCLRCVCVIL